MLSALFFIQTLKHFLFLPFVNSTFFCFIKLTNLRRVDEKCWWWLLNLVRFLFSPNILGYPVPEVTWWKLAHGGRVKITDNDFYVTNKQTADNVNLGFFDQWYTLKVG
jgi:hypothetical protein